MTEYQIFNMMYVGFISNSMYFVGMVLLTWLGFRMANNINNSADANMSAKVLTSLYCVLVGIMFFYTQQIGAAILSTCSVIACCNRCTVCRKNGNISKFTTFSWWASSDFICSIGCSVSTSNRLE